MDTTVSRGLISVRYRIVSTLLYVTRSMDSPSVRFVYVAGGNGAELLGTFPSLLRQGLLVCLQLPNLDERLHRAFNLFISS